ncbi:hypothetical protein HanPI659440_Chr16g0632651 [Helianthus annuus]|nr:hypothetical protein HanPI659440_Chr16g0632651 [Helianthus annuus]
MVTQGIGVKGFKHSIRREAIADPINLRIGKTATFFYGIFNDPLALQWAVLLMILSKGVPEQHF